MVENYLSKGLTERSSLDKLLSSTSTSEGGDGRGGHKMVEVEKLKEKASTLFGETDI